MNSVRLCAFVCVFPAHLCMLGAQLVEDVGGVEAGVVAQLPGDDLQRLGVCTDQQLLLARDGAGVVPQVLGQLHLDGATAGHDGVVLCTEEEIKVMETLATSGHCDSNPEFFVWKSDTL